MLSSAVFFVTFRVNTLEISVRQQIYYSNRQAIPAREIADSLLALEGIVQLLPEVLIKIFPDTQIQRTELYLDQLKSDSLWEDIVVKFVFGSQEKLDQALKDLREKIGMDNLSGNNKILAAILILLIGYGAIWALKDDKSIETSRRDTVEGNNNVILNIGAAELKMDAEQLKAIIESAVKDKKKLSKDATRFAKPAKRDDEASISFNGSEQLRLTPEVIRAMPSHVATPEEVTEVEDFSNVEISIRAIDLDNHQKGWAAVVPVLDDRRVKLHIDPGVDTKYILAHTTLMADITVVFDETKRGKKYPKLVFLRKIVDTQ